MYAPIVADYGVRSIFIGGGTPSLLDESLITNIMAFIRRYFHVEKNAEVTIEANPGTLRHQKLNGYKAAGINRISIGLQSCDDDMLKKLGRIHNFDQFVASYNAARRAGFQNINIDIMSGLPGQTIHTYVDTLSRVIEFGPEHISAYSLSIEEGTPFAKDPQILSELPPEMVDRRMYEITKQLLAAHGYDRYEFSNYAKPGYECKHNMVYWTGGEYIGFGIGASSYFQGKRFNNMRDIFKYIELMEKVGVDIVLSSRLLSAGEVLRFVRKGGIVSVSLLEGAQAEALEIIVGENSDVDGVAVRDMNLPPECLLCAIVRGNEAYIPNGNTVLHANDRVILFIKSEFSKTTVPLFEGRGA